MILFARSKSVLENRVSGILKNKFARKSYRHYITSMKNKPSFLFKATQRLILRPLAANDYDNWVQAYSIQGSPQNKWDETNWGKRELTRVKFRELLKSQKAQRGVDHTYTFGVFRKDDGVLLGLISLMDISRGIFQNAYLGYRIFNNYWGNGYAREACLGMIDFAFGSLSLHRVEAGIAPTNKRSLRTARSIGLRWEGLSKRRLLVDKRWVDLAIYALTKEEHKKSPKLRSRKTSV